MKQLGTAPKAIRQILLPVTGKKAMKSVHVSPIEEELMKHLHSDGLGIKKVAARSTETVSKHLFRKTKTKSGRVGTSRWRRRTKTISRAFWAHGVHFRPLHEKPDLSPEDVKERFAWAGHSHRSALQWERCSPARAIFQTLDRYAPSKSH